MEINEILEEIHKKGCERTIYNILHNWIMEDYRVVNDKNEEYRATINAVKKINNGKNEAIDSLCDDLYKKD